MRHLTLSLSLLLCTPIYAAPYIDDCPILPRNSIWNLPIETAPLHLLSDQYIQTIGPDKHVHPDFGAGVWQGAAIGIPYIAVSPEQEKKTVYFTYDDESDPGPYPHSLQPSH